MANRLIVEGLMEDTKSLENAQSLNVLDTKNTATWKNPVKTPPHVNTVQETIKAKNATKLQNAIDNVLSAAAKDMRHGLLCKTRKAEKQKAETAMSNRVSFYPVLIPKYPFFQLSRNLRLQLYFTNEQNIINMEYRDR